MLLQRLEVPARAAVERLLSPLEPEERPTFLHMLKKLTAAFNETARVPLLSAEEVRDSLHTAENPRTRAATR